jgi:hypothetical protein
MGFRGNSAVSFGADGTFACEGEGCSAVRCTLDGKSLAADALACAGAGLTHRSRRSSDARSQA